jgi:CysZ protein
MIEAAFKALGDLTSPEFRSVLWKAIGLTLGLFVAILLGVQALFYFLTFFSSPWIETFAAIGASLGLVAAFFFLMAPVTSVFAGFFLDDIATKVEKKHYPQDKPGTPLAILRSISVALQFAALVLITNVLALPLVFTGFGIFVLIFINAYLLSREYFEMAAMRHVSVDEAKDLRKRYASEIFMAGLIPALIALVPILNLTVPLFSTSYFVHLFKKVKASSV